MWKKIIYTSKFDWMRAVFAALVLVLFISNDAIAQWKLLHSFDEVIMSIYSIDNDSVIFVGCERSTWRSSDFGNTWLQLDHSIVYVASFDFKDNDTGWLTFQGTNGVMRTTDAGITWKTVYFQPAAPNSVHYQFSTGKLFLMQWGIAKTSVSTDEGNTWQPLMATGNRNGIVFTNDHHAVIAKLNGSDQIFVTDDDGATWTTEPYAGETWQPVAIPGTDVIIMNAEAIDNANAGPIEGRSTDGGYTWTEIPGPAFNNVRFANTGDDEWCDCGNVILTQAFSEGPGNSLPPFGVLYSSDSADSWMSIGGPTNQTNDARLFYSGNYIYAGDSGTGSFSAYRVGLWRYAVHHYPAITTPGPLQTCQPLDTTIHISFTNSCFGIPASLDSAVLTGSPAFSLRNVSPHVMQNEENLAFHYSGSPATHDTAWLHLYFNQHGDRKDTILQFIGSGPQPDQVTLHCVPSINHASPGKTFALNIYPDIHIQDASIDTISFTLQYWNDLLNLSPITNLGTGPITVSNGIASLPVSIIGTNMTLDPSQPIATIYFDPMLTDTIHTQISLTNAAANPSDKSYGACVLSLNVDTTSFHLDLICGDTTILTALEENPPFSIESIVPNPAQDKLFIALMKSAPVSYELLDELGNVRLSGPDVPTEVDLTSRPEGVCFLRFSSGGYVQTRRFVIQR